MADFDAKKIALTLTDDDWKHAHRIVNEGGICRARWTVEEARALLAVPETLVQELSAFHLDVLARHERISWGASVTDDALDDLYSEHLIDHEGRSTSLGRQVLGCRKKD